MDLVSVGLCSSWAHASGLITQKCYITKTGGFLEVVLHWLATKEAVGGLFIFRIEDRYHCSSLSPSCEFRTWGSCHLKVLLLLLGCLSSALPILQLLPTDKLRAVLLSEAASAKGSIRVTPSFLSSFPDPAGWHRRAVYSVCAISVHHPGY